MLWNQLGDFIDLYWLDPDLDPDPYSSNLPDPDPDTINPDPHQCFEETLFVKDPVLSIT